MTAAKLALLLAAAFACALLSGCGRGGSTEATEATTDTVEGAAPAKVPDRLTMGQAVDLANAVNLRAADVPYFEERPEEEETEEEKARERRIQRDFGRCLGVDVSTYMLRYRSPDFENSAAGEVLTVQSSVEVASDAALARRRAEAYDSRRGRACFERMIVPLLEEEGSAEVELGEVSAARLSLPMPAVEGGVFGYRISTSATFTGAESQLTVHRPGTVATPRRTIPFYFDILGFTVGPAEVSLLALGAPAPVSKNLERNLLAVLHERTLKSLP